MLFIYSKMYIKSHICCLGSVSFPPHCSSCHGGKRLSMLHYGNLPSDQRSNISHRVVHVCAGCSLCLFCLSSLLLLFCVSENVLTFIPLNKPNRSENVNIFEDFYCTSLKQYSDMHWILKNIYIYSHNIMMYM